MTAWRLIQKGSDPVVVCYLLGADDDARIRAALPGCTIVSTVEAPLQGDLAGALKAAGRVTAELVLVGFSAGCQPVRAHLVAGIEPIGVVTIDGTHAALNPPVWQIEVWKKLAEEARRGERIWVATCIQQTYVEHLQPPHTPYMADVHVLERVLDQPLPPGTEIHEGALHVLSYPSKTTDGQAHIDQQNITLPKMLREYVAPWLADRAAGDATPDTDRSPTRTSTPLGTRLDFGEVVLAIAEEDLNLAPREQRGRNAGDFIERMYLRPLGFGPGTPYCAAAATSWIKRAEQRTGMKAPILGSPGAQAIMQQLKAAGRWVPRAQLTPAMLRAGMLLVWDRADYTSEATRKATASQGHVAVVIEGVGEHSAGVIEGNADRLVEPMTKQIYAVVQSERRLDDPKLFGAGYLGAMPPVA